MILTRWMMLAAGAGSVSVTVWLDALNAAAREFRIDSAARLVPWLANIAHECAGFQRMTENLSYSAETLLRLFECTPKRIWGFTPEEAKAYAHQPEQIANRIYGRRNGNGPGLSGDGWRYRGRGPMMLTGKNNYIEAGDALGYNLVGDPDIALAIVPSARIAAWYFESRGCNELADVEDNEGIRRKINGGLIGFDDVMKRTEAIKAVLD